jgi:Fe-S cluster biogenesis protein NfuA
MSDTTTSKKKVMLYTEQTPNPEALKFVLNRMLYKGAADFSDEELARDWSPLSAALHDLPYVQGVFISNNFVSVTKEMNYSWSDIMLKLKQFIKEYVEDDRTIVKEGFEEVREQIEEERGLGVEYAEEDAEIANKIIELLDQYVKPAVEMDGGNIAFKKFKDGVVTLELQGACSGCPSSTVTLKSGIEGMLKRMVPQVKEVVALME